MAHTIPPIPTALNGEPPYPKESYAWFVTGVLMIVYIFSFMDRQILNLLVDPIKEDLQLTDTQVSYLGGLSFAVFYTLFGIPIGRMADSKNRKVIISFGLGFWSLCTMLCGTATRYTWFLAARMGVGVGEATLSPSAYSMISDMFRPNRLALAISIYSAGIYIGAGLSLVFGAGVIAWAEGFGGFSLPFIGGVKPWQMVFFIVGFPGLLFTLVVLLVKEPIRRGMRKTENEKPVQSVPFIEVFSYIGRNWRTFFYHNFGFALVSFVSYGSSAWLPSFLIRVHDLSRSEAGYLYGSIVAICGTLGIIFGGWLSDKLTEKGYQDAKMRVALIAALLHIPFGILYPLMPSAFWVAVILVPAVFTVGMPTGIAAAAIQQLMPNRMRAQASAVYLFVVNMIGLGIGPSAVAWCTDYVYGDPMKVGMSLLWISTIFGIFASAFFYLGMRHFRTSLSNLEDWKNGIEVKPYTERQMYLVLTSIIAIVIYSIVTLLVGLPAVFNGIFYGAYAIGFIYLYIKGRINDKKML